MLFTLFLGFLLGSLTIIVVQVLGFLFILNRLDRKRKEGEEAASSKFSQLSRDLDPQESLDFAYNKQGVVWVLESEKVPKSRLVDKVPSEQKRKKEILEVSPVRKYAKIKDRSLILIESDGSHKTIRLKDCIIVAVSATALSSRKWAKRYPIKVESKTSVIYNGSKTVYIYLETSWDKESWCKALRHASCDDKERLNWFAKLSEEFRHYVTSLNAGYPSFMKPSVGFYAEPMDRENRLDGSSSKVRLFLKKLAKKASKTGVENKASWTLSSGREDRKICEKSRSFQDSVSVPGLVKTASKGKTPNGSVEENMVLPSSSTLAHSGSQSHVSVISDTDPDDKFGIDEGTLCWNLLISRLFFDAKSNAEVKSSMQSRIQRTLSNMRTPSYIGEVICTGIDLGSLPPYIHGMRFLPTDLNEVWALEIDIEYSGGAVLDIETRLEVRELDLQKGIVEKNIESSSMGEVTSDLLEGFEYYGEQLKLSGETVDAIEQKDERDPKHDGIKSCKSSSRTSTSVSRWKSILNSIAKQVSQVPLSLAIRVASLRGTLRLHIKPPPSDQLWFGFTSMPDIDFNLESSVGEHKITSGHIGLFLVSRFKTAIRETLLLPNYESVCIPWMLADKDDWVPQKVAPFIWVKQEAVNDPTTVREVPGCQPGDAKTKIEASSGTSNDHPEVKHEKPKNVERVQQPIIASSDTIASSLSFTNPSTQGSKSSQELRTPLLKNVEPQETFQCGTDENPECQSLSRSVSVTDDDDDARPKRVGRKERMLGLGKKMGEKLEEKRRHIEEKGRHIVEKMRGP